MSVVLRYVHPISRKMSYDEREGGRELRYVTWCRRRTAPILCLTNGWSAVSTAVSGNDWRFFGMMMMMMITDVLLLMFIFQCHLSLSSMLFLRQHPTMHNNNNDNNDNNDKRRVIVTTCRLMLRLLLRQMMKGPMHSTADIPTTTVDTRMIPHPGGMGRGTGLTCSC